MIECKVLHGPLAFDRVYQDGESVVLSDHDAQQLAGYKLVEIVGKVKPTFAIKKNEVIPVEAIEEIPAEDEVISAEAIEEIPAEDEVIPAEAIEEGQATTRKRKR